MQNGFRSHCHRAGRLLSPFHPWPISRPKSPNTYDLLCFQHHHLVLFVLFWFDLSFGVGLYSVPSLALALQLSRLYLLSEIGRHALLYYRSLMQKRSMRVLPHPWTSRDKTTTLELAEDQETLKNNPIGQLPLWTRLQSVNSRVCAESTQFVQLPGDAAQF